MKKLSGFLIFFFIFTVFSYGQTYNYQPNKELYIRLQPLYIITHATFMLETEYYFSPAHGLALDVFYSLEVYDSPNEICFGCYMTSFAENRTMLSINYKYYLPTWERGLYISPYLRWRNWRGDANDFVVEDLYNEEATQNVVSNGFAAGGTIGVRSSEKGRFDFTFYTGYGFYFHESYQSEMNYTIRPELLAEWRMGLNIGFRVYKAKGAE